MFKNASITYSKWFPGEPDFNDFSKQCTTINYLDDLLWRSAPCENTTLFVVCQLICPKGTTLPTEETSTEAIEEISPISSDPTTTTMCPSKWLAGPSKKFPGCFRVITVLRLGFSNALTKCQSNDKRAHLIYLPDLENGTDLIELG
uniref:C-type lectin domain-containing protein n=1 Tax=Romanomermis culicivorax TaxID=13658 RepID=A0A915I3F1_ROMCU